MLETELFVSIVIMNGRNVECVMRGDPSLRFRQKPNHDSTKCKSPGFCFSHAVEHGMPQDQLISRLSLTNRRVELYNLILPVSFNTSFINFFPDCKMFTPSIVCHLKFNSLVFCLFSFEIAKQNFPLGLTSKM